MWYARDFASLHECFDAVNDRLRAINLENYAVYVPQHTKASLKVSSLHYTNDLV